MWHTILRWIGLEQAEHEISLEGLQLAVVPRGAVLGLRYALPQGPFKARRHETDYDVIGETGQLSGSQVAEVVLAGGRVIGSEADLRAWLAEAPGFIQP